MYSSVRSIALAVCAAWLGLVPLSADASGIGIVLMHGNRAAGDQFYMMAPKIEAAGYGLMTPNMCWSNRKRFNRTADDCMSDVDDAIAKLKAQGYDRFVVAGHSMGGINTLLYAAHHEGLAGVIVFAPSAKPRRTNDDPDVVRSRELVAEGMGDKMTTYPAGINDLEATPSAWLSFNAPESPLYDTELLPKLTAPLLWVAGTQDNGQRDAAEQFKLAPSTPLNRLVMVKADHFATPDVAVDDMIAWLNDLKASLSGD